jgi:hypothetical protein
MDARQPKPDKIDAVSKAKMAQADQQHQQVLKQGEEQFKQKSVENDQQHQQKMDQSDKQFGQQMAFEREKGAKEIAVKQEEGRQDRIDELMNAANVEQLAKKVAAIMDKAKVPVPQQKVEQP